MFLAIIAIACIFVKNGLRGYTPAMRLTQAILPVAGLGTRFLPWTKVVPKELLPIGNEPIIAKLVDECLSVGIDDICFVISPGKELIPQYFNEDPALEAELSKRGKLDLLGKLKAYDRVKFHVVYQHKPLGDGHAIMQAADWVEADNVAVLFGDDLIIGEKNGLQQLFDAWSGLSAPEKSAVMCLQDIDRNETGKYGIVDIAPDKHKNRLKKVIGMVEKPKPEDAPSTLGIVGKYIVPKSVIMKLRELPTGPSGELRLIDSLHASMNDVEMYGYEFEGRRFDTGTPEGYKETVQQLG